MCIGCNAQICYGNLNYAPPQVEEVSDFTVSGEVVAASSSNSQNDYMFTSSAAAPTEQDASEGEGDGLTGDWECAGGSELPSPSLSPVGPCQVAAAPEVIQIDDSSEDVSWLFFDGSRCSWNTCWSLCVVFVVVGGCLCREGLLSVGCLTACSL